MVYTSDFAQRFKLPQQGITSLDQGLQALAFQVAYKNSIYQCSVHLYLDANLAIEYPEFKDRGRLVTQAAREGDLFFITELSGIDQHLVDGQMAMFSNRVLIRTTPLPDGEPRGGFETAIVSAYDRELLPALSYISFNFLCSYYDPEVGPMELYLLKSSAKSNPIKNYHHETFQADDDSVYRFAVPEKLQRFVWPTLKAAGDYTANQSLEAIVSSANKKRFVVPN